MKEIPFLFLNPGWLDLIDIAMFAFIIYRFMSVVKGTRSVQIVLGLVALSILYWFSVVFSLNSIYWLLDHFFNSFFVIVIILFQEQIKTALVSFGESGFINFRRKNVIKDFVIEEVVTTLMRLSQEKTGALIVFEKNHGLLNYVNTGTRMDSKIHNDLLYSIFQHKSSLHDGAVIIFRDRILAAGCFLPLSKNSDLNNKLGTRHRAALGLTEVSDAVVMVVSEESGQIHVCYEGVFYNCENANDIRFHLKQLLILNKSKMTKRTLVNKAKV